MNANSGPEINNNQGPMNGRERFIPIDYIGTLPSVSFSTISSISCARSHRTEKPHKSFSIIRIRSLPSSTTWLLVDINQPRHSNNQSTCLSARFQMIQGQSQNYCKYLHRFTSTEVHVEQNESHSHRT